MVALPASSTSSTQRECSVRPTGRSPATCSWGWTNWIGSVARASRHLTLAASIATLLAGHGVAQVPVGDTSRKPPIDTTQRRLSIDPLLLKAGAFVYDMSLERDASTTPLGSRTMSAATVPYAGSPAWLLLETRVGDR